MYSSLYYMFDDLFGIKLKGLKMVQTFGFFVAIAFLTASYLLAKELKRKEGEGLLKPFLKKVMRGEKATPMQLFESFIIAFIVGYKLFLIFFDFDNFTQDTQGYLLSLKGNLLGGLALGGLYAYLRWREKEKQRLPEPKLVEEPFFPHQMVGDITLLAAAGGLVGAKIFDSLENFDQFKADPWGMLFSFSGLTVYGGLIVGSITVLYYAKKKGISLLPLMDAAAPAMMIAYSIGRIGCQMAGDGDWGIVNTAPKPGWMSFLPNWMWAYNYPHNVSNLGVPIANCLGEHCTQLDPPVFPTPFYETVMAAILFFILWRLRKRIVIPGVLFCLYLAMNGVERFLIETIRVNTKYHFLGIEATQAQLISPIFFLVGIGGMYYLTKKAKSSGIAA